jgi:hypothetical protein
MQMKVPIFLQNFLNFNHGFQLQKKVSSTFTQGDHNQVFDPVNVTINSNGPVSAFFWLCGSRST